MHAHIVMCVHIHIYIYIHTYIMLGYTYMTPTQTGVLPQPWRLPARPHSCRFPGIYVNIYIYIY